MARKEEELAEEKRRGEERSSFLARRTEEAEAEAVAAKVRAKPPSQRWLGLVRGVAEEGDQGDHELHAL